MNFRVRGGKRRLREMAAVLNVKDVRVGIGYHGRRPRKVKREYGEFVVEEQEVFSDLIEGKILRADDVTVRVELEAEEALFYSDARMSTVECNAVTAWLARYEDATLEVFVRTLQKDIEEKEAELAQNLFSSETDLGGEERGKTLNYHLEVFERKQEFCPPLSFALLIQIRHCGKMKSPLMRGLSLHQRGRGT